MKKSVIVVLFGLGLFSLPAYADCIYKGKYYPTGTVIGGKTCQKDGTWK